MAHSIDHVTMLQQSCMQILFLHGIAHCLLAKTFMPYAIVSFATFEPIFTEKSLLASLSSCFSLSWTDASQHCNFHNVLANLHANSLGLCHLAYVFHWQVLNPLQYCVSHHFQLSIHV